MGATNEQTNGNKVQGKNKTKFLYYHYLNSHIIIIII